MQDRWMWAVALGVVWWSGLSGRWCRMWCLCCGLGLGLVAPVWAQGELTPGASAPEPAARHITAPSVPHVNERLTAREIGLVINTADPYSVAVGEFYREARHLTDAQVLRLELPRRAELKPDEFEELQARIKAFFGPDIQALALAWVEPFAVACNSITGALALGYDSALCWKSCAPSRPSRYFNSPSARPYTDLQMRPAMLLAAKDVAAAEAMIRRGVASDHTLGLQGAPDVRAHYLITSDKVRNARVPLFPAPGRVKGYGIDIRVDEADALDGADRLLLYETGRVRVDKLDTLQWVPGGLGDHLTSFGGRLDGKYGQMSALEWITSGATGSYGTVSEPCAYPQKFPHPQVVLLHYMQGSTLIEAYWKSVAWPQQGLFIGEPLAAPFAWR